MSTQAETGNSLAEAEFVEPIVIDAEVMAELMDDGLADLLADLLVVVADGLNRLLVDADLVGEDEVVVLAAPGEGNAVVKAEEGAARADAGLAAVPRRGAALDHDLDVLDAFEEVAGEGGDGFADETAEAGPFQVVTSALLRPPRGYGSPCR